MKINISILGATNVAWVKDDQLQGGKYTIEKELGRGRFGITYLVKNQKGDRQVIKTLNDDLLTSLSKEDRGQLEKDYRLANM